MSYQELKAKNVVGRKDYRCEWCNEEILKGQTHFSRSYIFEGDFNSGRMHLECATAMSKVDSDELQEGWSPGDFKRGSVECR